MSATGRKKKDGTVTKRSERDFYETPGYSTKALFRRLAKEFDLSGSFFEPAAGNGAIIAAATPWVRPSQWVASDIHLGPRIPGPVWLPPSDFRSIKRLPGVRFDFLISNPPFCLAQDFIDHGRPFAEHMILLLRLNYLGSLKRHVWWKTSLPERIYVLAQRPIFTSTTSDACEYGWFHWRKGQAGTAVEHVEILGPEEGRGHQRVRTMSPEGEIT